MIMEVCLTYPGSELSTCSQCQFINISLVKNLCHTVIIVCGILNSPPHKLKPHTKQKHLAVKSKVKLEAPVTSIF